MLSEILISRTVALTLLLAVATTAFAQEALHETLDLDELTNLYLVKDTMSGNEIKDYQVFGERSQILSVDLMTSTPSNYFNILPVGTNQALFIGSTQGTVADLRLPASGAYVIRVYLMQPSARRGETAEFSLGISLGPPEFADGLSGGPDYWRVSSGSVSTLNLRAGPSTRYKQLSLLRNGEVLKNRGCRLTGSERWCTIRATHSGVTGWVAGRYLVESAAPRRPEGGPKGNGVLYDATGFVPCAARAGQPMQQCPFGVVREGYGNAGLWVSLEEGGSERQILFENGVPVATNSADALSFEKVSDLFMIRIGGERFEIPYAAVSGG